MPVPGQPPLWRRLLQRHRRTIAATLLGIAVVLALLSLRPAPAAGTPVLVARTDLPPGRVLTPDDVEVATWPPGIVPPGTLTSVDELPERPVAAPIAAGEPLLPGRFLAPSALSAYGRGLVATPVRLADAGTVGLLREGDLVDVLAATAATTPDSVGGAARTVAQGVRVLLAGTADVADSSVGAGGPGVVAADGALVVLATTPQTAADIAGAAVTSRLSVVLRSG